LPSTISPFNWKNQAGGKRSISKSFFDAMLMPSSVLFCLRLVEFPVTTTSWERAARKFAFAMAMPTTWSHLMEGTKGVCAMQGLNSKPAPYNQQLAMRASQRDSQSSQMIADSGLQRVIRGWRDLPANLKAAILAIVSSVSR
jgi:cytochrome c biogenesis factor